MKEIYSLDKIEKEGSKAFEADRMYLDEEISKGELMQIETECMQMCRRAEQNYLKEVLEARRDYSEGEIDKEEVEKAEEEYTEARALVSRINRILTDPIRIALRGYLEARRNYSEGKINKEDLEEIEKKYDRTAQMYKFVVE